MENKIDQFVAEQVSRRQFLGSLIALPVISTSLLENSQQRVCSEVISPEQYGAIPNDPSSSAATQNTKAFNAACAEWLNKGGILQLGAGCVYHINTNSAPTVWSGGAAIDARPQKEKPKPDNPRLKLEGRGATLRFTNDGDHYSFLVGGHPGILWNEHGCLLIEDLTLTGAGESSPYYANSINCKSYGLSIQQTRNVHVVLRNVKCEHFRVNFHLDTCWPLAMRDCVSTNGYQLLWVDSLVTSALYDNCQFIQGWYGMIFWPGNQYIINQTFNHCRFETLRRLGVINPKQGEYIRSISVIEPYAENWGEPLLIGKRPDLNNWRSVGDDSVGMVYDSRFIGGYWDERRPNRRILLGNNVVGTVRDWPPDV